MNAISSAANGGVGQDDFSSLTIWHPAHAFGAKPFVIGIPERSSRRSHRHSHHRKHHHHHHRAERLACVHARHETMRAECDCCGHRATFVRDEIHHALHAILTVATVGLWAVSWLALIIGRRHRPWMCTHCGAERFA